MTLRRMQITGRVGQEPELDTYDGTPVANLSVATERYQDDETVWVSVTVWGPKAKFVRDYIEKGEMITAHGAPNVDAWEGRDGANAELTLNADTLEPAGSGGNGGGRDSRGNYGGGPAPEPGSNSGGNDEPFNDEEIPF
ncbi:MAG: single-stranded DNA-binding protein [Bradymonadaceae bacterium]